MKKKKINKKKKWKSQSKRKKTDSFGYTIWCLFNELNNNLCICKSNSKNKANTTILNRTQTLSNEDRKLCERLDGKRNVAVKEKPNLSSLFFHSNKLPLTINSIKTKRISTYKWTKRMGQSLCTHLSNCESDSNMLNKWTKMNEMRVFHQITFHQSFSIKFVSSSGRFE